MHITKVAITAVTAATVVIARGPMNIKIYMSLEYIRCYDETASIQLHILSIFAVELNELKAIGSCDKS